MKKVKKHSPLLNRYYEDIMDDLDKDEKSALTGDGALSNDEVYIDAYSVEYPETKILNTIDQWSSKDDYGVMLIHGEPGHGKTTLCRKAVYEHVLKQFCPDKKNVFWFRLNPAFAEGIIEKDKFVLKNAFCWGDPEIESINRIRLEENEKEYQNSVVFLDGYDELQAQLHDVKKNLKDFITTAKKIAQTYDMHIVITTRTRSLSDKGELNIPSLQFAPMTEKQQINWIHKRKELHEYEEIFVKLRNSSEETKELLGIPILFRMVVEAELEDTASGVVELYDKLFRATMEQREMKSRTIEYWHKEYEQLAYEIYCNDGTFANMRGKELPEDFLYLFYLKGNGEKRVEFLHRSFYQYFLAHFLYRKMSEAKDEASAEAFLCCLAERRINRDVLNYIQQIQEKKLNVTQGKCEQIINTLEQTGTIIIQALHASNENGNAEKHRLRRCNNIFVNALSICCIVAATKKRRFTISLCDKKNIHQAMKIYNCMLIRLDYVDLSGADLSGANLTEASLKGVDLRWVKNLDKCRCEQVTDWTGCKILLRDRDSLSLDDSDTHGIIWCNNDGDPIEP